MAAVSVAAVAISPPSTRPTLLLERRWCRMCGGWLQALEEGEPLESNGVCLQQIEQRLRYVSVHRHEVTVGVVLEQRRSSVEDIAVVLDQPFGTRVRLTNLALSTIGAEEPVVAQRV